MCPTSKSLGGKHDKETGPTTERTEDLLKIQLRAKSVLKVRDEKFCDRQGGEGR